MTDSFVDIGIQVLPWNNWVLSQSVAQEPSGNLKGSLIEQSQLLKWIDDIRMKIYNKLEDVYVYVLLNFIFSLKYFFIKIINKLL